MRRDDNFQLQPRLAESWEIPDPLTYIFHLRHDVRFHDGRAMTSADVKWTLDSLLNGTRALGQRPAPTATSTGSRRQTISP